jgi:carboxymethylenebutenolidase
VPKTLAYAPAAGQTLVPTTIRTGEEGLETSLETISSLGRDVPLYSARPRHRKATPVVLVLSEAFGLHAHIADVARRFAHEGYFAIAPDLMARQGDPMSFDDVGSLVSDLLLKIPDSQVMADLDVCVEWAESAGGDVDRLVTTGFCWGGRWAWLYAAHRPMRCAIPWYGILDGRASRIFPVDPERFPAHPVDLVDSLQAPVHGLYGANDEAIGVDTVQRMRLALSEGNRFARESSIVLYQEAGHAFFADYRASYHESSALDAWQRCLGWMREHTQDAKLPGKA